MPPPRPAAEGRLLDRRARPTRRGCALDRPGVAGSLAQPARYSGRRPRDPRGLERPHPRRQPENALSPFQRCRIAVAFALWCRRPGRSRTLMPGRGSGGRFAGGRWRGWGRCLRRAFRPRARPAAGPHHRLDLAKRKVAGRFDLDPFARLAMSAEVPDLLRGTPEPPDLDIPTRPILARSNSQARTLGICCSHRRSANRIRKDVRYITISAEYWS